MTERTATVEFELPQGFDAEIDGSIIKIKGNGKETVKDFKSKNLKLKKEGNKVIVKATARGRRSLAIANTVSSILNNIITGLKVGYLYKLAVVYSHFPMNIQVKGNVVEINNFAGEKKQRKASIIGEAKVTVKGKEIFVEGTNLDDVSLTAANIESAAKLKGKDNRIFQDGIYIIQKGVKNE